ncbi:MAG: DHH family phosphoesterase [Clostridiales bacterium]|jgi:c-di-AMP phosphodiesterase-like protein|nr:DHH family phosphoesterase [Clostridiales bacterium]
MTIFSGIKNLFTKDKTAAAYDSNLTEAPAPQPEEPAKEKPACAPSAEPAAPAPKPEPKSSAVIVGLIFIDNYEEVFNTVEEVRRPLMVALIDRKLSTLAQQVGGIVKKFEKDKYIFIFPNDQLDLLKKNQFSVLKQVREIDMGNQFPVTLSIGLGVNGATPAQSMEFARAAIDLALGRGGDQALIKDGEKYDFFGGITKEIGRSTRVRARVKAFAFAELAAESSGVIVAGHRNIDLDCLGASVGVYKICAALGKSCKIILGDITTNVEGLHTRLLREADYGQTFISKNQAAEIIDKNTLLVIVDAHKPSILEAPELLTPRRTKKIVVIDHHRKAAEFIDNAVLTYHEPYASSTCELLTEMLQYVKADIKLKPVEADALLAGITVDTKNFTIKTGAKTFDAAAYLKRNGADSAKVRLLFQNDLKAFKAKATAVNSAEIFHEHIALSVCPADIENPSLTAAQAADELLNISGILASFVLSAERDTVYICARSFGALNVQVIMEKLGGGGHQTVAGAQIEKIPCDKVMAMLKDAVNNYIKEVSL